MDSDTIRTLVIIHATFGYQLGCMVRMMVVVSCGGRGLCMMMIEWILWNRIILSVKLSTMTSPLSTSTDEVVTCHGAVEISGGLVKGIFHGGN